MKTPRRNAPTSLLFVDKCWLEQMAMVTYSGGKWQMWRKKKFTHMVILSVKINVGLAKGLWVLRVSELGTIRVRKKSKDYTLMLTQTTKTIHVIYSIHIILFL